MEVSQSEHGTLAWPILMSPDPAAGLHFYSELFAWESSDSTDDASGSYATITKGGKLVALARRTTEPGPASWLTCFSVRDVASVANEVEPAGGKVASPPTSVALLGKMAIFEDTTGASVGTWQAGDCFGAEVRFEPATFISSELGSSDVHETKRFYSEILGWGWGGRREEYPEAVVNGRIILGVLPRTEYAALGRPDAPDYWLAYFTSRDVYAQTSTAASLGAKVLCEPRENFMGRTYAIVSDPQGAPFGLYDFDESLSAVTGTADQAVD